MTADEHYARCVEESETGRPAWPCPNCGHDKWTVFPPFRRSKHHVPTLFSVTCGHCHALEDAHHVDGGWLYMHRYSKHPGSLCRFVEEHAAYLRSITR